MIEDLLRPNETFAVIEPLTDILSCERKDDFYFKGAHAIVGIKEGSRAVVAVVFDKSMVPNDTAKAWLRA
ncbi:hypothetical protein, partial [Candidatus Magnetobacterium casense]